MTAASQLATMLLGAVLALLVLLKFGKDAETDGFFAAYGVYAVLLSLAQSMRATVVARLVEGTSLFTSFDRFLGATLLVFAAAGVPLVALGTFLAELLTGASDGPAPETARTTLALLWPAAGAQLVAALAAATLGARDEFLLPALAYAVGAAGSILVLLALSGPLGIDAVAAGVSAGSLLAVALIMGRLLSRGHRLRIAGILRGGRMLEAAAQILVGSMGYIVAQLTYVVSLAFVARIGEGAVTLYSYSFFGALLLMGATSGVAAIVLAAPLSQTWDRRPQSLEPHLVAVLRAGLALVLPIIAVFALVGDELIDLVPTAALSGGDADVLVGTFLALSGLIVFNIAMPVPMLAALAKGRYRAIAAICGITVVAHIVSSAVALETDRVEAIAAAASLSALVSLAGLLRLVWGSGLGRVSTLLGRELLPPIALTLAVFAPAALLGAALGGGVGDVAASGLGLAALALAARRALPAYWELARRFVRPLLPARRDAGKTA